MNEIKKLFIAIGIFLLFVLFLLLYMCFGTTYSKDIYNQFKEKLGSEEKTVIYLGREGCRYCQLFEPVFTDIQELYKFNYLYIDTDQVSDRYLEMILNDLDVTDVEKFGTPYLAIVSNNEVVDTQSGYADYNDFFNFLQENDAISDDAKLDLNYIDYDKYDELLNGSTRSIIVVGGSLCDTCNQSIIVLNGIVNEYDLEINYINYSKLTTDEQKEFVDSLDIFEDATVPIMLIVQDGKLVDSIEDTSDESDYVEFLEENEVI